jgi:hypothetical protein
MFLSVVHEEVKGVGGPLVFLSFFLSVFLSFCLIIFPFYNLLPSQKFAKSKICQQRPAIFFVLT